MDRAAAISFLCDGGERMLLKPGPEDHLTRPNLSELGLEELQTQPGCTKAPLGGGSLPDTPESALFPPDFSLACSGALQEETCRLIGQFYRGRAGLNIRKAHPALGTMNRVVERVIQKHSIAYNGMVKKLCLEDQDERMDFISSVAKSMFSDGTTNWGRIVSLVGFGAVVCDHLKELKREHCMENVIQHISTYLNTHQHQWLINNKAWDGFVEFFREDDTESVVRGALMAFAGFAGLGAGLALLMR